MKYFVIRSNDEGEVSVAQMDRNELETRLNEYYWGDDVQFLNPADDLRYNSGLIIIKGEVVRPKARQVVQEWEV